MSEMGVNRFFLDNLWRWKCGIPEVELNGKVCDDIKELFMTQWSKEFESLMRNRLIQGGLRYGLMHDKPDFAYIKYAIKRLQEYDRTGNQECLIDASNLSLLEFVERTHPKAHLDHEKNAGENEDHVTLK